MLRAAFAMAGVFAVAASSAASAQSLQGSRATMVRQNSVAQQHDFTFLKTGNEVRSFVEKGYLVPVHGNESLKLSGVSYPYARPAVKLFIERLARQYENTCGEKLVVTSLTRPLNGQPANASDLSVHPAGMAVDLRISRKASCRNWLERTLNSLEARGVIDATRETRPAHYHIAVFPESYTRYVAALIGKSPAEVAPNGKGMKIARASGPAYASVLPVGGSDDDDATYTVRPGDSLWGIARKFNMSVADLQEANNLGSNRIVAGQKLSIPGPGRVAASDTSSK